MESQLQTDNPQGNELKEDLILCPHCLRTANNGIKCQGICVADSNYYSLPTIEIYTV